MKVIDLLNKIANGEEVPEKIQVYSDIFVLDYGNKVYEHEKTGANLLNIYNGNILSYEVRIKEDNKIEKLEILPDNEHYSNAVLYGKINKIIDYINGSDKE